MHELQWDYSFPGHHTGKVKLYELLNGSRLKKRQRRASF